MNEFLCHCSQIGEKAASREIEPFLHRQPVGLCGSTHIPRHVQKAQGHGSASLESGILKKRYPNCSIYMNWSLISLLNVSSVISLLFQCCYDLAVKSWNSGCYAEHERLNGSEYLKLECSHPQEWFYYQMTNVVLCNRTNLCFPFLLKINALLF